MKRSLKLLAAALSCAALSPASAQSLFIDTAQPVLSTHLGALGPVMEVGGPSAQRLAQTLTVEMGGTLVGVYLPIDCFARPFLPPGRGVVVSVVDVVGGSPGTWTVDRALVDPKDADAGGRFVFVPFTGGMTLKTGDQIALVLENRTGACHVTYSPATANYAGGNGFVETLSSSPPGGPGWIPLAGHPMNLLWSDDFPFQLVLQ
jgi:hypothetical protein